MKIIHKYLLKQFLKTLSISLVGLTALFLLFDFFEKIDKFSAANEPLISTFSYLFYKIPYLFSIMIPLAILFSAMISIGLLSKNSEITAMRASGLKLSWLMKPILITSFILSFFSLFINETIVPYATSRSRDIYNIDIRRKDQTGGYSQKNLWWRDKNEIYSAEFFDSRTKTLFNVSEYVLKGGTFKIYKRIDAKKAEWINPSLKWSMHGVKEYLFLSNERGTYDFKMTKYKSLPMLINETPEDFYKAKKDPFSMSYFELKDFMKNQEKTGLSVKGYEADLYAKISFPFVCLVICAIAIPFALKPARSGSLANSVIAGFTIGFSYFAIHSLSVAMGRAELFPPFISAWVANILMGLIAIILNIGAEDPS
ncbi:MAG: LPS export ABC transporter permease LptG [Bdellovibrionota bacterium]